MKITSESLTTQSGIILRRSKYKYPYIYCRSHIQMGRTRLELFGITNETKKKVQIIAKEKNMSTATLLEPVLRKYVEEPSNKRIIYRHGSRQ